MSGLFPADRPRRRIARPESNFQHDGDVPAGIVAEAKRIGARGCFVRNGLVLVLLADLKEVWLNREGQQTGRAPGGRAVAIRDDVVWGFAPVNQRTRAA